MKESMGQFILRLRKENNMTQKQLVGQLHVSDKAVSKWERELSHPDVAILPDLSRTLGVSTAELIDGKRYSGEKVKKESTVQKAIPYRSRWRQVRIRWNRKIALWIVGLAALIAMGICLIVDFVINRRMTWSGVVVASVVYGYLILLACLFAKKHW